MGLSPEATLSRGYAIVRDDAGRVVRAGRTLNAGDGLRIQLQHGQVAARVEAVEPEKG
jgi:exodeoxyribonuclease VII large subunit